MSQSPFVRAIEPEDFAAVKTIYAQPLAFRGTLQMPYPSAQIWRQRLENPPDGGRFLVACVDEVPVGHIGLIPVGRPRRQHVAGIGMAVHDDFAGRGIGGLLVQEALSIADRWLDLKRIELTVYTDNDRAIRLYRRHGFEEEGILRQFAFRDGEYVDALTMARLR